MEGHNRLSRLNKRFSKSHWIYCAKPVSKMKKLAVERDRYKAIDTLITGVRMRERETWRYMLGNVAVRCVCAEIN